VGYAGASVLLLLKLRINPRLRSLRDIVWFVVIAAIAAPLVVALLQAINFAWSGIIAWSKLLILSLQYWAGDATGIAMLAPFLLVLLRRVPWIWAHKEQELLVPDVKLRWPTNREVPELLIEIVAIGIGIWLGYGTPRAANLDYTYFVFLPLIWIAVQHGFARATGTIFLINVSVAILVRATYGESDILALQFGIMAISQTGLLLGGISTERMQAFSALGYSAKRLTILHKLDRQILAARSPLEIAEAALVQIQQLIPCQETSIIMFDFAAREFTVLAGQMGDHLQAEVRLPLEAFGDISALQQGEVNMVQDILISAPPAAQTLVGEGIRAYVNVPLVAQGELIGCLNLGKEQPGAFKPIQVDVAYEAANLVAIAIQQVRLFSRVEQQATRERSLNQISRTLNSSLDPEQILQKIVQLTGEYFSVDRVIIFAIPKQQIQVLNEWRTSDQVISVLDLEIPLPEFSTTNDFQYRQVFHVSDIRQMQLTSGTHGRVQQTQLLSVLSVPILIRDQLFGRLSLQTTITPRTFTDDEIHLLERIADQAAIALYNAQSYERLEYTVKQRTQELEQEKLFSEAANRAKTNFMSNMSHELRTPLTSILGFSSILIEQIFGPLNAKQDQYLELISSSGKHLLALINDLLDLTKIEVGREELLLETIVVEEIASSSLSLICEDAKNKGLQLSLLISLDVTTCVADKRRLKQILVNLLSNAVKFTESGSITLKVNRTADKIEFSVIDTGIGIAQAEQATLFQPFHQLDSGLNRKYEGSGLGLALSRKLAQLHGGDITIHSELVCGSCFTLYLPDKTKD
jgi:signal transduction histidine kinase